MKTREELLKTNYELGVSKVDYQTANMDEFKSPFDPSYKSTGLHKFKNYNRRIDIITGQILNNNYKSSGYECFTENSQSRYSGNQTYERPDRTVSCPITGRNIIGR
jgi:hypothetical protein